MAMIEKIRRQGWLVLVMVGIGLLGFLIPYDAVMSLMGGTNTDIGKIDGHTITAPYWQNLLGVRSKLFRYDGNQSSLENDTWNQLIDSTLYTDEFEELGLQITDNEYEAMMFGDNLSPFVLQTIYQGKDSAEFKEQMRQQFERFEEDDQTMAQGWKNLIIAQRKREKYDAMVKKGIYANNLDGKWAFKIANDKVNIDYVVKTFAEIPDSTISYTDGDLRAYYNKHKNDREYKQEASRSIEYIRFPVQPSASDSTEYQRGLTDLITQFSASSTDSAFAATKASNPAQAYVKYTNGTLPEPWNTQIMTDSIGTVVGPYLENNAYKIAKIVKRGSESDSVQARHILIKEKTPAGKAKADSIKNVIAKEKNFAAMAAMYGTDGTKDKGGDLGMFGRGAMVAPFENAAFNTPVGELKVVETNFGFHVLEVTKKGASNPYTRIAVIDQQIAPSKTTVKSAYQLARDFSEVYQDTASFRNAADTLNGGTTLNKARDFKPSATALSGLQDAAQIVNWAYGAELNEVSQPFLINDNYIIAVVTDIKERGAPSFENVRDKMKDKVIKEKKAEKYLELMKSGSLEQIAAACSTTVKKAENMTMRNTNIPNSGVNVPENKVVGAVFGLPTGKMSLPIVGEGGVYVIQRSADIAPGTSTDNYVSNQESANTTLRSKAPNGVLGAYKEIADITDNRYGRR